MTEQDVVVRVADSDIFKRWHWFSYHFNLLLKGNEPFLAGPIISACLECETAIPGFADEFISAIASICGREKHLPHYEQLLQRLAELFVIRQLVRFPWPTPRSFRWEPTAGTSKKNPEICVEYLNTTVGFEVKAPSLIEHINKRSTRPLQIPSRSDALPALIGEHSKDEVTLPRDNPVKDFLISANEKFAEFKKSDPRFIGILVIVWDDFIYEPISSLLDPGAGLFTPKSFAKKADGSTICFENVDGVVIIRYLHQIIRATREHPLIDGFLTLFDYGTPGSFPFKAFVQNPNCSNVPAVVLESLQAEIPSPILGAEYVPSNLVWWTNHE